MDSLSSDYVIIDSDKTPKQKEITLAKISKLRDYCTPDKIQELNRKYMTNENFTNMNRCLIMFYALEVMHYLKIVKILDICDDSYLKEVLEGNIICSSSNTRSRTSIRVGDPCMVQILKKDIFIYILKGYIVGQVEDLKIIRQRFIKEIGWCIYRPDLYEKVLGKSNWEITREVKGMKNYLASLPFPIMTPLISNGSIIEFLGFYKDVSRGWRNRPMDIVRKHGIDSLRKYETLFYDSTIKFPENIIDDLNADESRYTLPGTCDQITATRVEEDMNKEIREESESSASAAASVSPDISNISTDILDSDKEISLIISRRDLKTKNWESAYNILNEYRDEMDALKQSLLRREMENIPSETNLDRRGPRSKKDPSQLKEIEKNFSERISQQYEENAVKYFEDRIERFIASPLEWFCISDSKALFKKSREQIDDDNKWFTKSNDTISDLLKEFKPFFPPDISNLLQRKLTNGEYEFLEDSWNFSLLQNKVYTDLVKFINMVIYAPEFILFYKQDEKIHFLVKALRKMGCFASKELRLCTALILKEKNEDLDAMDARDEVITEAMKKVVRPLLLLTKKSWDVIKVEEEHGDKEGERQRSVYYIDIYNDDLGSGGIKEDVINRSVPFDMGDCEYMKILKKRINHLKVAKEIKFNQLSLYSPNYDQAQPSEYEEDEEMGDGGEKASREIVKEIVRINKGGRVPGKKNTLKEEIIQKIIDEYVESFPLQRIHDEVKENILKQSKHIDISYLSIILKVLEIDKSQWSLGEFIKPTSETGGYSAFSIVFSGEAAKTTNRILLSHLLWYIPLQDIGLIKIKEYYQSHSLTNDRGYDSRKLNAKDFHWIEERMAFDSKEITSPYLYYIVHEIRNRINDPNARLCTVTKSLIKGQTVVSMEILAREETGRIAIRKYIAELPPQSASTKKDLILHFNQYVSDSEKINDDLSTHTTYLGEDIGDGGGFMPDRLRPNTRSQKSTKRAPKRRDGSDDDDDDDDEERPSKLTRYSEETIKFPDMTDDIKDLFLEKYHEGFDDHKFDPEMNDNMILNDGGRITNAIETQEGYFLEKLSTYEKNNYDILCDYLQKIWIVTGIETKSLPYSQVKLEIYEHNGDIIENITIPLPLLVVSIRLQYKAMYCLGVYFSIFADTVERMGRKNRLFQNMDDVWLNWTLGNWEDVINKYKAHSLPTLITKQDDADDADAIIQDSVFQGFPESFHGFDEDYFNVDEGFKNENRPAIESSAAAPWMSE